MCRHRDGISAQVGVPAQGGSVPVHGDAVSRGVLPPGSVAGQGGGGGCEGDALVLVEGKPNLRMSTRRSTPRSS